MQGLGIAAFAYYRRLVEYHKENILDEIIRAASKQLGSSGTAMIDALERSKTEIQFSKAMDSVKPAVPQALLINGHNPLTLLHAAISKGLHAQTDEECLEQAQNVRVVLIEMTERISLVLKDRKELDDAVSALMGKT